VPSRLGRPLTLASAGLALLLLPLASAPYFLHLCNLVLIYCILALSLQLLLGYAGQLSLGHAAFFGTGAYASAIVATTLQQSVWLGLVVGTLLAGLVGLTMAPISRLRGNYLVVATIGFNEIVHLVILNWVPVTHGPLGFLDIPAAAIAGLRLDDDRSYYYLALVATVAIYLGLSHLVGESRFGRALAAIRQNQSAAAAMGVSPAAYKIQAFVISAALAGLAGGLFAHLIRYLNPNDVTLDGSILVLMMIVVGGLRSLEGAIIGAVLLTLAPEYLRVFQDYRLVVYAGLLIVMMIFIPDGLVGLLRRAGRGLRRARLPARARPMEAEARAGDSG
jgi:branched-chain amino acid transport system permease protein